MAETKQSTNQESQVYPSIVDLCACCPSYELNEGFGLGYKKLTPRNFLQRFKCLFVYMKAQREEQSCT